MTLDRGVEQALDAYVQELQAASDSATANARATEALGRYYQAIQEVWAVEPARQAWDAYGDYVRALQEQLVPAATSKLAGDGFRRFVRTVQETWSSTDVDALDPASLAAVGQALMNAAWLASLNGADGGGAADSSHQGGAQ